LHKALALAARWAGGDPVLVSLYASAKVQGADPKLRTKTATIGYLAAPFTGGHFQMFDWEYVETCAIRQLAADIARSLRYSVRTRRGYRRGWVV
jgi:hypothetical protein